MEKSFSPALRSLHGKGKWLSHSCRQMPLELDGWVQIPGLLLGGFMICGKLFKFLELQFPHLKNGDDNNACFTGRL